MKPAFESILGSGSVRSFIGALLLPSDSSRQLKLSHELGNPLIVMDNPFVFKCLSDPPIAISVFVLVI